ncbi:MAG: hypothetical protein HFE63_07175 [Clostridiales bacterium]|nr:hypothetical protein [Clostridiales bacterium]
MNKIMKIVTVLLSAAMLFSSTACNKADDDYIPKFDVDITEKASLPADIESSVLTVSPVGGNPKFCVFEAGLTFYVYDKTSENASMCTLGLPEGYTNGEIVSGRSGAGSGEAEIIVKAEQNGETAFLSYMFFCNNEQSPKSLISFYDMYKMRDEETGWLLDE